MMIQRKFALLMLLLGVTLILPAQERRPHFSKEEFRARQKEFMIRKAELTKEEAKKFFPLYFELQDKKKTINDHVAKVVRDTKKMSSHQTNYGKIIDIMMNSRIEADKLESAYVQKYRKFMSDKKIFKVLSAEMNFHRELLKSMKQEEHKRRPEKR